MADAQVPRLHGYGVRWDTGARLYRVRNEVTGEWLRQPDGELSGFRSFSDAWGTWRVFEVHKRPGE
ncbi:hypothetical protein ACFVX9_21050 [Kitasatospora sp. NPDC058243]|uniref:hypothetical protein n=1 Tax=Kitasatospora sp. NPDC058243 TaxID=3346397 RepID=UPI0036DF7767